MAGGPLTGYRIIELVGIGPGPYCAQLLANMGAEVIAIERPGTGQPRLDMAGKKSLILDLRKKNSAKIVLKLVESADALLEGNRPGVAERLGVGPEACLAHNKSLVYGRMTGWGQEGPWAQMAGHDINYLAITGALHAMGQENQVPPPPLNLLGDYGGGSLFLALGIVAALLQANKTGKGDVIDAAIIDGVSSMTGILPALMALGQWQPTREANLLDGGAPFYRCYKTKDERFMAVGCIEPPFFTLMLTKLGLTAETYGNQYDQSSWPGQRQLLQNTFAHKTREAWAAIFDNTDACVTPVLSYMEAPNHKQNKARQVFNSAAQNTHANKAPRFASTSHLRSQEETPKGGATQTVLQEAGFSPQEIANMHEDGLIS